MFVIEEKYFEIDASYRKIRYVSFSTMQVSKFVRMSNNWTLLLRRTLPLLTRISRILQNNFNRSWSTIRRGTKSFRKLISLTWRGLIEKKLRLRSSLTRPRTLKRNLKIRNARGMHTWHKNIPSSITAVSFLTRETIFYPRFDLFFKLYFQMCDTEISRV